jgi:hypothetical protein
VSDQPKRKIDDLFPEYDIKLRNWILEKLKEDLARSGVPKNNPYYYLVSPSKQTEDDPMLRDKYLAESLSNIRRFVKELWPRKGKRGRMVRVGAEWYKTKDE